MNYSLLKSFIIFACVLWSPQAGLAACNDANHIKHSVEKCRTAERNCGVMALCTVARFLGSEASLSDVAHAVVFRQKGFSLLGLQEAAKDLGFYAYTVRLTPEDLYNLEWPAITYMNELYGSSEEKHFLAVIGQEEEKLLVFDPPRKFMYFPIAYFTEYWDGETLVVSRESVNLATLMPHAMRNIQKVDTRFRYYRIPLMIFALILIVAGIICLYRGKGVSRVEPKPNLEKH